MPRSLSLGSFIFLRGFSSVVLGKGNNKWATEKKCQPSNVDGLFNLDLLKIFFMKNMGIYPRVASPIIFLHLMNVNGDHLTDRWETWVYIEFVK